MYIRIIGNSCSGKTTLSKVLSAKLSYPLLHLDSIAFIPGVEFRRRSDDDILRDYSLFLNQNIDKVVEGTYFDIHPKIRQK